MFGGASHSHLIYLIPHNVKISTQSQEENIVGGENLFLVGRKKIITVKNILSKKKIRIFTAHQKNSDLKEMLIQCS